MFSDTDNRTSPRPLTVLSRVGIGAWAFGGVGWGPQEDRDSIATIHRAVELGINWIDTAAVYGEGHAERIVGAALTQLRPEERPLVLTKAGVLIDAQSGKTYRDLSPDSLRAECEASLRRLKVDRIDVYQLHWPVEDAQIVEDAWDTLLELQREGKIRWTGASNFDVPLLDSCALRGAVDLIQTPLSLLNRAAARQLLPWAARTDTRAIVYSPLESGLLSGSFSSERLSLLPDSDWRRRRAQFRPPQLQAAIDLVEQLKPIAAGSGCSLIELAIAWTLSWPGVSAAIVGARTPAQVDSWVGAEHMRLREETLLAIESALLQTNAGAGPMRPSSTS